MHSLEDFVLVVYCLVDDLYRASFISKGIRLRASGPPPKLSDSEAITMVVVGEFLGIDTDEQIHEFFGRAPWDAWFPCLGDRSTFVRQTTNLWVVFETLQRVVSALCGARTDTGSIVDGFPMVLCALGRAGRCRLFRGQARVLCGQKAVFFRSQRPPFDQYRRDHYRLHRHGCVGRRTRSELGRGGSDAWFAARRQRVPERLVFIASQAGERNRALDAAASQHGPVGEPGGGSHLFPDSSPRGNRDRTASGAVSHRNDSRPSRALAHRSRGAKDSCAHGGGISLQTSGAAAFAV